MSTIYPISFSIPENKIISYIPKKNKKFATIIPGDTSTYLFNDEESYYKDYQESIFGKTKKKGGWDCMRHYEILANGCIPYFENLESCPPSIMSHLPKDLILEAMSSTNPEKYIKPLLEYTRKHLTTKAMAKYILSKITKDVNNVLFLSNESNADYLRDTTLIGLKEIFGKNCTSNLQIPFLYKNYKNNVSSLYGKGFSYTKILNQNIKNLNSTVLNDKIKNKKYDLVIYGSAHRGMLYLDDVIANYNKSSIVFLCGEDEHSMHECPAIKYGKDGYHAFIRELIPI